MTPGRRQNLGYCALLAVCFVIAVLAGWTGFAAQVDSDAADTLYRFRAARRPGGPARQAMLLTVDEETLSAYGGMRRIRAFLADALLRVAAAQPAAVAVDLILSDEGDAWEDARLEAAFAATPNLVLASDLVSIPTGGARWEDPLDRFRKHARAVGHVHADPDPDGVNRHIPLEKAAGRDRRWALALETFRWSARGGSILESPHDVEVNGVLIPAPKGNGRPMRVRYLSEPGAVPRRSVKEVLENPAVAGEFQGKVVFAGVTAQSAARDRLMTPVSLGTPMVGVEIHAHALETIAQWQFLHPLSESVSLLFCLGLCAAAGLVFYFRDGWPAYVLGGALVLLSFLAPYLLLTRDIVAPFVAPAAAAWLSVAGAASYQHFVVRRRLRKAEAERSRYQQAIHFVVHEMRSPLTAIQGSSEIMGRYNLNEDKRKQIAQTIHAESKRLARMIQTFLDVERLSAGQMELKREPVPVRELVTACLERVRPLAERKRIRLEQEDLAEAILTGDRELLEYAVYNLLTNAIKYSPAETVVRVSGVFQQGTLRLAVRDQGIGMDKEEMSHLFRKFYRTRRAEASGEAGTGIGLSIVAQIVGHHGGRMEVASAPGQGSCFTMVVPAEPVRPGPEVGPAPEAARAEWKE